MSDLRIAMREVAMEMEEERKRNPLPPTPIRPLRPFEAIFMGTVYLVGIGVLVAPHFVDLPALLMALAKRANEYLPFAYLWAGLAALMLSGILYGMREIVGHPAYAPGEVLLGSIVAGYSVHHLDFAGFLGFAAGVRIIIEGYKRIGSLRAIRAERNRDVASRRGK